MNSLSKINWEQMNNLIPVITQDSQSKEVLMLAYMNQEALKLTMDTNFVHYYSRSKKRIWKKGEISKHTQEVVDILVDCDNDTLLINVIQNGVACHTGRKSCFFTNLKTNKSKDKQLETNSIYSIIDTLYHTICERKHEDISKSYTSKLLNGKQNSLLKKVIEEAGEFSFAIKDNNEEEIIYETADLTYHVLVSLASKNINPDRVKQELQKRFGISGIIEKNSRKN